MERTTDNLESLNAELKRLNITQVQLADMLGTSQSSINAVLKGRRPLSVGMQSRIEAIIGNGGVSPEPPRAVISYTEGVPYYDEDFLLGFDELCTPSHEGADFLVRMPGYEKATLWCNATGHSMEPEINSGDVVALQRIEDFSFLPFGDIYGIITTNGMRTIKRLGRSTLPGHYLLIPTNPTHDAQDIPIDKIAYVYRVLGALKHF